MRLRERMRRGGSRAPPTAGYSQRPERLLLGRGLAECAGAARDAPRASRVGRSMALLGAEISSIGVSRSGLLRVLVTLR